MPSVKEEVIRIIEALPDDCTLEDIAYHLYVREQVERGLADADAGRVIPHAEVKKQVAEWLRSRGLTAQ